MFVFLKQSFWHPIHSDLSYKQYYDFHDKRYCNIGRSGSIPIDCMIDTTRGKCYCAEMDLILRTRSYEIKTFTDGMSINNSNTNNKSNSNKNNKCKNVSNNNDKNGNDSKPMILQIVSDDAKDDPQVENIVSSENPLNFPTVSLPKYLQEDDDDSSTQQKQSQHNNNSNSLSIMSSMNSSNNSNSNSSNNSNNSSNNSNNSNSNNGNLNDNIFSNFSNMNGNGNRYSMNSYNSLSNSSNYGDFLNSFNPFGMQPVNNQNNDQNKRKNTSWTLNDLKVVAIGRVKAYKAGEKKLSHAVVTGYCPASFNMPSSSQYNVFIKSLKCAQANNKKFDGNLSAPYTDILPDEISVGQVKTLYSKIDGYVPDLEKLGIPMEKDKKENSDNNNNDVEKDSGINNVNNHGIRHQQQPQPQHMQPLPQPPHIPPQPSMQAPPQAPTMNMFGQVQYQRMDGGQYPSYHPQMAMQHQFYNPQTQAPNGQMYAQQYYQNGQSQHQQQPMASRNNI